MRPRSLSRTRGARSPCTSDRETRPPRSRLRISGHRRGGEDARWRAPPSSPIRPLKSSPPSYRIRQDAPVLAVRGGVAGPSLGVPRSVSRACGVLLRAGAVASRDEAGGRDLFRIYGTVTSFFSHQRRSVEALFPFRPSLPVLGIRGRQVSCTAHWIDSRKCFTPPLRRYCLQILVRRDLREQTRCPLSEPRARRRRSVTVGAFPGGPTALCCFSTISTSSASENPIIYSFAHSPANVASDPDVRLGGGRQASDSPGHTGDFREL